MVCLSVYSSPTVRGKQNKLLCIHAVSGAVVRLGNSDLPCADLYPTVGVAGTPVIDPDIYIYIYAATIYMHICLPRDILYIHVINGTFQRSTSIQCSVLGESSSRSMFLTSEEHSGFPAYMFGGSADTAGHLLRDIYVCGLGGIKNRTDRLNLNYLHLNCYMRWRLR